MRVPLQFLERDETAIARVLLSARQAAERSDRILAATARELGATLVTRDRALLDYGEQGHIAAVEC
ncbi:MAG: hypothetical protein ACLPWS_01845 [Rhodomicrobium sp.]